jgi:hypothetical protein
MGGHDGDPRLRKLAKPSTVLLVSAALVLFGSILAVLSWSESEMVSFGAGVGLFFAVLGPFYLLFGCRFVFPSLVVRLDRVKEEASHDLHRIKKESLSNGSHASYLTEIRERLALENNVRTTLVQALLGLGVLLGAELRGSMLDYANGRIDPVRFEQGLQKLPNFSGASLQGASLRCAHLEGSNFTKAKLSNVDLRDADLRRFPYSKQRDAILKDAVLDGAIWNEGTEWPDDVDPNKDEQLRSKLVKDDQLFARTKGSEDILLILGGNRVVKPRLEKVNGSTIPIEETAVQGGNIVATLHKGNWLKLAEPLPLLRQLPVLGCADYEKVKYWPGSPDLKCALQPRGSCPPKLKAMKEDDDVADFVTIARRPPVEGRLAITLS